MVFVYSTLSIGQQNEMTTHNPKKLNMEKRIRFKNNKINRKFGFEWDKSGIVNMDKVPMLVESMVNQRKAMVEYIEELHDLIDFMIEKNGICDVRNCMTANCTSDHK